MYNFPDNPGLGEQANGLEWDGTKWIAVWPTGDDSNYVLKNETEEQIVAGPLTAESFKGDGEEITGIVTDQLADVNSEGAVRDDLLIFNGTLWEATDFAFIETALTFKGGLDLTNDSLYPTEISDGDLYIANESGVVAASWTGIAGISVNAGNFVGWADSKQRWFLLGDLASSGVKRVGAGTGIDVDDAVAAVPVVSIDRAEVDTWYADLADFNSLAFEIEANAEGIANNKLEIEANTGDIADTNKRIDELALNDLTDVDAAAPNRNDYLVFNGADWESEPIALIDTELTYQGAIDMTGPAPVSPKNGDLYINDTDGVVGASWGVIAGTTVNAGNVVGWADKTARWYLMGDIASGSVTNVQGGTAIIVNDSVPASPVVNLDKTEVDKWYEPKFSKLSAFNKNFGTTAGTVAEGNHVHSQYALTSHTHSQYLTDFTETDPTVPAHVKSISTADIAKWNTPGSAPVSSVNAKTGAVVLTHTDVGAAAASHTHAYAPTSHTHSEYALTSHTHSEYALASHTHAYAPTNHTHSEYVGIGAGGTVAAPKIVIGKTGTDPNTLYFVV